MTPISRRSPPSGNRRRDSHRGQRPPVRRPYPWHGPGPGPFPNYLTAAEVAAIFAAARADTSRVGLRNYLLLGTSYFYGLRAGEPGLILRSQLDLDGGTVRIERLKGGLGHRYLLYPELADPFRRYLAERPLPSGAPDPLPADADFLFPSTNLVYLPGEAPRVVGLSPRSVHSLLLDYAEEAGVLANYQDRPGYVRAHALRHSIATHMLNAGCDLIYVQYQLGLVSPHSVERYAWFTDVRMDARMRKLRRHRAIAKV